MRHVLGKRPSMKEGCEFEICNRKRPRCDSERRCRNILNDVWYKAIICGSYVRLLKDDFSTPLSELDNLFRPIPPKNLQARVGIKLGSIVEADYKDAWWTGFVVKVIEDDKFLVCFDSPSDILQFERKHLRPYLEWVDERRVKWWAITSKNNYEFLRRLAEEPMFSPGTMVEFSSKINKAEDVWVPAMIIKEIKDDVEYKYIVKVCDKSLSCNGNEATPNKTVDSLSLRPTPPPFCVEEYQLVEYVEVLTGTGWRQGRVTGTLSQKRYLVLLEATKKNLVVKHSDLRPLKVWEDGVWKTRESPLTQRSGDKKGDSVINAEESDPPVTPSPSPGITATRLKQIEAETQRKTFPKKTLTRNQNGLGNDSTRENENSEDNNRKRKREENLCSVASVEENKAKYTKMVLPFEKKLPIWKTLESMEVFRTVPQSPHFSPLVETGENSREMIAVGLMYTFSGLLEELKLKALQRDYRISSLLSLHKSFVKLEKYGFNVKAPQLRISKLFSLRESRAKKMDELKGVEKVIAEKESVKVENKRKILELQRLNEEADKEIAESKSCAAKIVQQLRDVELQFQTTASAPR